MRASVRVVACAVVMLVGTARPADAIWRWLEHMSGPGWYDGFSIEFKSWVRYPGLPESEEESLKIIENETNITRLTALELAEARRRPKRPEVLKSLSARIDKLKALRKEILARVKDDDQATRTFMIPTVSVPAEERVGDISEPRQRTLGWSAGLLWSTINRLRYEPGINPEDTQVWVLTGGPYYDHRLYGPLNRLELGASAEGYIFFGRTTRTMFRVALEPRATVTIGTIRDELSGHPAINFKVRVGALWVVPGFDPEDFGALPGERLGPEVLTSIRLVIDFECLPWKRGSC